MEMVKDWSKGNDKSSWRFWVVYVVKNYWISIVPVVALITLVVTTYLLGSVDSEVGVFRGRFALLGACITFLCSFGGLLVTNIHKKRVEDKSNLKKSANFCQMILSEIDVLLLFGNDYSRSKEDFSFVLLTDNEVDVVSVYKCVMSDLMLLSDAARKSVIGFYAALNIYCAAQRQLALMKSRLSDMRMLCSAGGEIKDFAEVTRLGERVPHYEKTILSLRNGLSEKSKEVRKCLLSEYDDKVRLLKYYA